jgi:lysozyme family protein
MASTPLTADFLPGLPAGFRQGMRFIWEPEQDGHDEDSAPGEEFLTRWGITRMTWDEAVLSGCAVGPLEDATQATCGNVYLARFWNTMILDSVPPAIGFMLFADGTLTGVGHVASLLQRIVGAPVDGTIGRRQTLPATARYIAANGPGALIDRFIDADVIYLAALRNAPKFLRGWTRREREEQGIAHEMLATKVR